MVNGKYIRIGTWNVEYANNARNADRLAMLREHPADIWLRLPLKSGVLSLVENIDKESER
jgi:hypothetical protein